VRCRVTILASVFPLAFMLACGSERRAGDVDEIREAGELRVAVRPGYRTASNNANAGENEAALLGQLASRLGVKIRWIEAERHDQVLLMVRDGVADIGVARFSPASLLAEDVRGTTAVTLGEMIQTQG